MSCSVKNTKDCKINSTISKSNLEKVLGIVFTKCPRFGVFFEKNLILHKKLPQKYSKKSIILRTLSKKKYCKQTMMWFHKIRNKVILFY